MATVGYLIFSFKLDLFNLPLPLKVPLSSRKGSNLKILLAPFINDFFLTNFRSLQSVSSFRTFNISISIEKALLCIQLMITFQQFLVLPHCSFFSCNLVCVLWQLITDKGLCVGLSLKLLYMSPTVGDCQLGLGRGVKPF